ncbi:tRNA uridine-5-carboxymethylaminomethyl(34) synthesis GTPase MnmE [Stappia sp. F7233]|uniref:tRNA modification GTPase MnmE n=1 Tax=Stappia albiluteola TaxID=2758565 RepID=A0A839AJ10_9HYPH|nr:tRNA uridine-5-carboxymethylaminomethyl(34) synthesis GTPase MnmE [Stappia albiluteola]MBA5778914.1 tRNA uridine-5-carboxymethylaminomethyl(34) synthesis GTPase MnmE [Stappia albiluteola]
MNSDDTIYALSSGKLPAGIAVIRISGVRASDVLKCMAGHLPVERHASFSRLADPKTGEPLDHALVLWLPGPGSFTGEDIAELHCHGGRAVVAAVLDCLGAMPGLRPAEPGEFTRRAYRNGRLDLVEVEGLADLIGAETEAQRRQALRQADGALSELYGRWRKDIIWARAMIEAELDFADEEDVPGSISDQVWAKVAGLAGEIERHLERSVAAERLRDGVQVVLMGRPNAGKSSLLNALSRRDVAIVTEEAGTTRDVIEVHLDLGGYPVTLVDTAGIREDAGRVEAEGIRRARQRVEAADLVLWLRAADDPKGREQIVADTGAPVWKLRSKSDLGADADQLDADEISISMQDPRTIDGLLIALAGFVAEMVPTGEDVLATRDRHRQGLKACRHALLQALEGEGAPLEMRAEELRRAADHMGRITGLIGVEDLLDVIFGEFCIGK